MEEYIFPFVSCYLLGRLFSTSLSICLVQPVQRVAPPPASSRTDRGERVGDHAHTCKTPARSRTPWLALSDGRVAHLSEEYSSEHGVAAAPHPTSQQEASALS